MSKLFSMWIFSCMVLVVLCLATTQVKKMEGDLMNKWTSFECGFETMTPTRQSFSFQFFLIALLFLIFDVEIGVILAYPLETMNTTKMMVMYTFILLLTLGLIYEWKKENISWSE